ncbi:MAG: ligase-associated DNA damage response exonuclease [Burkholderiaceae bacterium]
MPRPTRGAAAAGDADGDLIVVRPEGLYCPPGDFFIDPWRPVDRAVITHAHADHARTGHRHYLAHEDSAGVLRRRLGADIVLQTLPYGEAITHHGVRVSLHPAGHVLGSAQVRLEHQGRVWVASGDYKTQADGTCPPFEPVRCQAFITESTFGLPVYRWPSPASLHREIVDWWHANAEAGRASVLYCYAFGKAQRILHALADESDAIGSIVVHGAIDALNDAYRAAGVRLARCERVDAAKRRGDYRRALVLAPPSAQGSPWLRRFDDHSDAFASGWMQLRGTRRRRGVDRGFVMSDHADWPGLQEAIAATGASRVFVTHGYVDVMVRWLNERDVAAQGFSTDYGDDDDGGDGDAAAASIEPGESTEPTESGEPGEPGEPSAV